jgi:DNA-binding GntR family transcriptional regulator
MSLTDEEIRAWSSGPSVTRKIAADLATRIRTGKLERYAELPSSIALAREWGAAERTVTRAKRLLFDHGLIGKAGTGYYVA